MNPLEAFQNFIDDAVEIGTNTVSTIVNWVTNAVNDAKESITNAGSAVVDFVTSGMAAINEFFGGGDDDDNHEPGHGSSGNQRDEQREQQAAVDFDIAQVEGKFGRADADLDQPFDLADDFPTLDRVPEYETSMWDDLEIISLELSNPLVRTIKLMSTTTEADLLAAFLKTAPSAEAVLNLLFAQAGYDEEMDQEAIRVLEMYAAERRKAVPFGENALLFQDNSDLPDDVSVFKATCDEDLGQCQAMLEAYGITVLEELTDEDKTTLGIQSVDNLTAEQYAILLAGVSAVSEELVDDVRRELNDYTLTPEQAFHRVFGDVRIGVSRWMQNDENKITTTGDPTNPSNQIYITDLTHRRQIFRRGASRSAPTTREDCVTSVT